MIYGTTEFYVEKGSVSITKSKEQTVRHFVGTDTSEVYPTGKISTRISCRIYAFGDTERTAIEALLHNETSTTLTYHNFYFKDVVPGESSRMVSVSPKLDIWAIEAEFIALDPVQYSLSTDEVLY